MCVCVYLLIHALTGDNLFMYKEVTFWWFKRQMSLDGDDLKMAKHKWCPTEKETASD